MYKKRLFDLTLYLVIILVDAMAFIIFTSLNLGTNPFGIFINNASRFFTLSPGFCAFLLGGIQILIAAILLKTRYKIELFIYNILFAVAVDLLMPLYHLKFETLPVKIILMLLTIAALDFSRTWFQNLPYPKLSMIEMLYGIVDYFSINLKQASRLNNILLFILGILLSLINKLPFYQVGVGTIIIVYANGIVLNYYNPKVKLWYEAISSSLKKG